MKPSSQDVKTPNKVENIEDKENKASLNHFLSNSKTQFSTKTHTQSKPKETARGRKRKISQITGGGGRNEIEKGEKGVKMRSLD